MTDQQARSIIAMVRRSSALGKMDGRKLAWLILKSDLAEYMGGLEGLLIDEIILRLFPEFDGENVEFTQDGWVIDGEEIYYDISEFREN